eukprot:scaffold50869_cov23-Tisochrysis_lutea.AAC.3
MLCRLPEQDNSTLLHRRPSTPSHPPHPTWSRRLIGADGTQAWLCSHWGYLGWCSCLRKRSERTQSCCGPKGKHTTTGVSPSTLYLLEDRTRPYLLQTFFAGGLHQPLFAGDRTRHTTKAGAPTKPAKARAHPSTPFHLQPTPSALSKRLSRPNGIQARLYAHTLPHPSTTHNPPGERAVGG